MVYIKTTNHREIASFDSETIRRRSVMSNSPRLILVNPRRTLIVRSRERVDLRRAKMHLRKLRQKMSLDQLPYVRRPMTKLLAILIGTLAQCRLVSSTNEPARLRVGRSLVKKVNAISADAYSDADRENQTNCDCFGVTLHKSINAGLFLCGAWQ
jgi:hypothetical protein